MKAVKESPFDHKTFQAIYEEFILSVKNQEGDEAWTSFIREKRQTMAPRKEDSEQKSRSRWRSSSASLQAFQQGLLALTWSTMAYVETYVLGLWLEVVRLLYPIDAHLE